MVMVDTIEDRLGEDYAFSDYIEEEYCLTHGLEKNTVVCRVFVHIKEPNGVNWYAERIIRMRLRKERRTDV